VVSLEALYWCASIFLWSFFTGIGLPPIPEEAGILYAASLATLHSEVHWWMAWPAASLGIIAADLALYSAGRLWGQRLLEYRWLARVLTPERRKSIEDNFHSHGMKFLLTARLLPPLRTGVFLVAGTIHYSLLRFLIVDVAYGIVGVGLVFFGGTALVALVHRVGIWLLIALAVIGTGVGIYFYRRYRRNRELKIEVRGQKKSVETVVSKPVRSKN
jgi:membrane protein DedA with SNARE-associated domain